MTQRPRNSSPFDQWLPVQVDRWDFFLLFYRIITTPTVICIPQGVAIKYVLTQPLVHEIVHMAEPEGRCFA